VILDVDGFLDVKVDVGVLVNANVTVRALFRTGPRGRGTDLGDCALPDPHPVLRAATLGEAVLGRAADQEEEMREKFHAHEVPMEMAAALRPVLEALGRRDRDLASRLRRATASVVLNIAEGSGRWGKDRVQHYRIAAGSAAEVRAALGLARAWGFVEGRMTQEPETLLARVQAMLWRLTQGRG
jgi:four helix bundle protein